MKGGVRKLVDSLSTRVSFHVNLILFGGAAMVLAYRSQRSTEDLDILIHESQLQLYAEQGLGEIFDEVNEELESMGLYIRHLWSPSQKVLSQGWENRLTHIAPWWDNTFLQLQAIHPIDLIASKLPRFDEVDRSDIRYLISEKRVQKEELQMLPSKLLIPVAWETEARKIKVRAEQLAHDGTC